MSFVNQVRHHWPIAVLSGVGAAGLIYLVVKANEHTDEADIQDNSTSDDESAEPQNEEKGQREKYVTVRKVIGRRASSYVQVPSMGIDLGDLAGWFHRVIPSSDYVNTGMVPKRYDSFESRIKRVTKPWTPGGSSSRCVDKRRTIKSETRSPGHQDESVVGEGQAKVTNNDRFTKRVIIESGVGEMDSTVYSQIKEVKDKDTTEDEAGTNVATPKTEPPGSHCLSGNKERMSTSSNDASFPIKVHNSTNIVDSINDSSEEEVETRESGSFIKEKSSVVLSDQSVQMNNNRRIVDVSSDSNNGFEDTNCTPIPSRDADTQASFIEKCCGKCSDKSQSDSYRSALECASPSRTCSSVYHSDMSRTKEARLNEASNDENQSSTSNRYASSDFMSTEMSESIEFVSRRLADIVTMANLGASTVTTGPHKKHASSVQPRLSRNTCTSSALLNEQCNHSKPKHTFMRSLSTPNVATDSKCYEMKRKTSASDVEESPSMVEFERLEKECITDTLPISYVNAHQLSNNRMSADNPQRAMSNEHGDVSANDVSGDRKLQIEHAKRLTKIYLDELLDKLNASKTCGECRKTKDSQDSGIAVASLKDERSSSNRSLEETLKNIITEADESLSKLYRYDALGETLNGRSLLEEILEAAVMLKAQDSSGTSMSNIAAVQPSSDNSVLSNILPPTRLESSVPKSSSVSPVKSLLKGNLFPFEKPVKDIASKVRRDAKNKKLSKKSKKVSIGNVSIIDEAPAAGSSIVNRVGKGRRIEKEFNQQPSKIPQLKVKSLTKRTDKQEKVSLAVTRLKGHQPSKIPRLTSPSHKQDTRSARDLKKRRRTQVSMIPTRRKGVGCTSHQVMMVNAVEFSDLSFLKDLLSRKFLQKETKACGDSQSSNVHFPSVVPNETVAAKQRDKYVSQNDMFASLKHLKISQLCDNFEHKTLLEPSWKSPFKRHFLPSLWTRISRPQPKCTTNSDGKCTNSLPPSRRKRLRTKRELDENLRKVKSLEGLSKMTEFDCRSGEYKQPADDSVSEPERLQHQSEVTLSRDSSDHDCLCIDGELSNENYLEESLEKIIQETNEYLNNLFNERCRD